MDRRNLLKLSPLALLPTFGYVAAGEAMKSDSSEPIYNVRSFGATGDGKTVDTPAVNRALEAVAAAGGGTLVFPAGTYVFKAWGYSAKDKSTPAKQQSNTPGSTWKYSTRRCL